MKHRGRTNQFYRNTASTVKLILGLSGRRIKITCRVPRFLLPIPCLFLCCLNSDYKSPGTLIYLLAAVTVKASYLYVIFPMS